MSELTVLPTVETSLAYLMKNYTDYNHWANCTLVNWLKTKPRDILEIEVHSSFNTIRQTLIHMLQTQSYWYSVIRPEIGYEDEEFTGNLDETFDRIVAQSEEMAIYIENLGIDMLQEDTLVVSQWFECNFPKFEYIMHCMNHSTYHRGQIVTMGRNLGFTDAPMTDYNFYNVMAK